MILRPRQPVSGNLFHTIFFRCIASDNSELHFWVSDRNPFVHTTLYPDIFPSLPLFLLLFSLFCKIISENTPRCSSLVLNSRSSLCYKSTASLVETASLRHRVEVAHEVPNSACQDFEKDLVLLHSTSPVILIKGLRDSLSPAFNQAHAFHPPSISSFTHS